MKSIISDDPSCFICGTASHLQTHHCVHGYHRRFADDNGLTVPLCVRCHHNVHNGKTELDIQLKRIAQAAYEGTRQNGREEWMEHIGRNYL